MAHRTDRPMDAAPAGVPSQRRDFLRQMASAGLAFGLPPLMASCGGGGDDVRTPVQAEVGAAPPARATELRTLFFNLSYESYAGKRYFLEAGGLSYDLVPVTQKPEVLAAARASNGFLRSVSDDQVTHHVENVTVFPASSMTVYVGADLDKAAGTWTMSGIWIVTGTAPIVAAHAQIVAEATRRNKTLVASAQRKHYGLPASFTATDLLDQSALLDLPSFASALIGAHPSLFALEPVALNVVQHGHVQQSIFVDRVAYVIGNLGAASPGDAKSPNGVGWATLVPVLDPDTKVQARIKSGPDAGRLQYRAQWNSTVAANAGQGMGVLSNAVKDDPSLGADITGGNVANAGRGKLWFRRDGETSVVHPAGEAASVGSGAPTLTLKDVTSQGGLKLKVDTDTALARTVDVTIENWYLRYLCAYVQFLDAADPPNVIALADMPEYAANTILLSPSRGTGTAPADDATTFYVGPVPPVACILGIPIEGEFATGQLSFQITLPAKASAIRVLSSGIGGGSLIYPHTVVLGASLTAIFNLGFTALFAAAGAATFLDGFQSVAVTVIDDVIAQLLTGAVDQNAIGSAEFWIDQAAQLAETLVAQAVTSGVRALVTLAVTAFVTGDAEKSVPIVDIVMAAISAFIGAAELIQTTVELALSPWTYVSDIVFTTDLSVTLVPSQGVFPAGANLCRVTAMIDDGTPHVQLLPLMKGQAIGPVVFRGVPFGGNVNVSTSFSQTATVANASDILLGKGSTGSQPNDGKPLTLSVEQIEFPIGGTTTYRHQQKTMVDDADNHVWTTAPAPTTTASADCSDAGTICGLRSITVRQKTASEAGYVGYSWQSQNADPSKAPSCTGGGAGQLDQVANLSTSADAQNGYALSGCGFDNVGVRVAYNLLSRGPANFYLDTNDSNAPVLRQVSLDGSPSIGAPGSQQAWGVLNLSSDLLLLHPSGHAVSVNGANHKIETHKLPRTASTDPVAKVSMLAQVKSGKGSRPGLIDTPTAAAITADGTLLILETGNNRIQALNLGANPVQYFAKQPQPYFLRLDATSPELNWVHLDMAVEFTGFIYVLSMNTESGLYQMNIYHPSQGDTRPVATATAMNAARLTVDFWRNVYTLNYEVIQRSNPSNSTAVPVTEPSISLWTPCNLGQTCPV